MLRSFMRDEKGVSTIEFVVLAPIFFLMLFWSFELGIFMYRWSLLERGLDKTVRSLMLGDIDLATSADPFEDIKDIICLNANNLNSCNDNLHLELNTTTASIGLPTVELQCIDKEDADWDPIKTAHGGNCPDGAPVGETEIVYLRACVLLKPTLTSAYALPFPKDSAGYVQLRSSSAFVNEPC